MGCVKPLFGIILWKIGFVYLCLHKSSVPKHTHKQFRGSNGRFSLSDSSLPRSRDVGSPATSTSPPPRHSVSPSLQPSDGIKLNLSDVRAITSITAMPPREALARMTEVLPLLPALASATRRAEKSSIPPSPPLPLAVGAPLSPRPGLSPSPPPHAPTAAFFPAASSPQQRTAAAAATGPSPANGTAAAPSLSSVTAASSRAATAPDYISLLRTTPPGTPIRVSPRIPRPALAAHDPPAYVLHSLRSVATSMSPTSPAARTRGMSPRCAGPVRTVAFWKTYTPPSPTPPTHRPRAAHLSPSPARAHSVPASARRPTLPGSLAGHSPDAGGSEHAVSARGLSASPRRASKSPPARRPASPTVRRGPPTPRPPGLYVPSSPGCRELLMNAIPGGAVLPYPPAASPLPDLPPDVLASLAAARPPARPLTPAKVRALVTEVCAAAVLPPSIGPGGRSGSTLFTLFSGGEQRERWEQHRLELQARLDSERLAECTFRPQISARSARIVCPPPSPPPPP